MGGEVMSRRYSGRRQRTGQSAGGGLFGQVASIFNTGRIFLAANVNTSGGSTTAIRCAISSAALAQVTPGNQCPAPTPDASANNAPALAFSGAQWYDSSDPPSYWKSLNDFSGATLFGLYKPGGVGVYVLHSTRLFAAVAETGHTIYQNALVNWQALESNGVVEACVAQGGIPVVGTPTYISQKWATASTPDADLRQKSASVATANATAPSVANPDGSLRLGAGIAPSNRLPLVGNWYGLLYVPRVITAAEDTTVQEWIRQHFGIAP